MSDTPHPLAQFDAFANLGPENRQLLGRALVLHRFRTPSAILHKGQAVSGAYVVTEGRLRVFTLAPNGTEATLYFIDPGETCVLALNCLFNDFLYPAWVQPEGGASVALIPGAVYRVLFDSEPAIRDMTVRALSTAVFRLMAELELVHSSHHRQRLANFILNHAASDGCLRMTQQQLASHLGTSREVVARLIGDFVEQGLIATGRGSQRIRDVFRLRDVVLGREQDIPPRSRES